MIGGGLPVGFAKIRLGDDPAIAAEAHALEQVERSAPTIFSVPTLLDHGEVDGWSYLVTSPLPPGRHRMLRPAPVPETADEIAWALSGLARPEGVPTHWRPMHGDLTPWNLRATSQGTWLIDWETAGWGPHHADEVLYRAVAAGLGRPVPGSAPADVAEAVDFWVGRIGARADQRRQYGQGATPLDTNTLGALTSMRLHAGGAA